MIDISKKDKAAVLAALYNNSRPQGLGMLHYDPKDMTREEAAELLEQDGRFDYLKGRVLKIDLRGDTFNPFLYDRDLGEGAAQRVVDSIPDVAP